MMYGAIYIYICMYINPCTTLYDMGVGRMTLSSHTLTQTPRKHLYPPLRQTQKHQQDKVNSNKYSTRGCKRQFARAHILNHSSAAHNSMSFKTEHGETKQVTVVVEERRKQENIIQGTRGSSSTGSVLRQTGAA